MKIPDPYAQRVTSEYLAALSQTGYNLVEVTHDLWTALAKVLLMLACLTVLVAIFPLLVLGVIVRSIYYWRWW